jgi:hypothetical protein
LNFDPSSGLHILHIKDCHKLCFNPEHLYAGTPWDNAQDYVRTVARRRGV